MGGQILEWSVRAALIAAGTAAVLSMLRVRSAAARHAAWTVVLVAMLALPAWNTWGPRAVLPVLPAARPAAAMDGNAMPDLAPAETGLAAQAPTGPRAAAEGPFLPVAAARPARVWNWEWAALGVYLAGFGVMFLRLAAGTLRARTLVRRAAQQNTPDAHGVRASAECAAPLTVGWLRPVVVLPEDWKRWPAAELDAVLTHEREHARRRDPLVQWLALLNRCVFWFHPLSWWLERKLSALAEHACDEAVLRRGHDPRDYSEYLIELARSVQRAGARMPVWGAAMHRSALSARIHRILQGGTPPPPSRRRAAIAAILCGLTIAVFAACKLEPGHAGWAAQKPAPGQPSMNDLMHTRADQNAKEQAQNTRLLQEARELTPQQANALVARLRANPEDAPLYFEVTRYYQFKGDTGGLDALTLWYIQHEPGGKMPPWTINPDWDRAAYERGKQLWLANLKDPRAGAEIYRRAARYFAELNNRHQPPDAPEAERILLEGQSRYPAENWAAPLGELYAAVIAGDPNAPYARDLQAKLAASNDPQLLAETAQWMVRRTLPLGGFDAHATASSYVDRALSIDPDNRAAHLVHLWIDEQRTFQQMRATDQEHWPAADHLRFLRRQVEYAQWAGQTDQATPRDLRVKYEELRIEGNEETARELLAAAARNPKDPDYGNAVFFANMALCNASLHRGDKRAAARYLLAASEAPPTERLRYGSIDLSVARHLVDWGERDAVAQFLERCSKYNLDRGKDMAEWAAEIRKGVNPDLLPYNASL